jgi:hypothetical protein
LADVDVKSFVWPGVEGELELEHFAANKAPTPTKLPAPIIIKNSFLVMYFPSPNNYICAKALFGLILPTNSFDPIWSSPYLACIKKRAKSRKERNLLFLAAYQP